MEPVGSESETGWHKGTSHIRLRGFVIYGLGFINEFRGLGFRALGFGV